MRTTWGAALALAVTAGCAGAHGAGGPQVTEADFGRLTPVQTTPVDEGRRFVSSARDELGRAKLRQQEAAHETDLARADQQMADADAKRAEVEAKVADQSREPAQLDRARQLKEQATLHRSVADAHADYAKRITEANQASVDAANRQVDLANARLELAKLHALQQAGVPAATKYDAGKFQARVTDAQKKFDKALQHARDLQGQATASQQRWQEAQRQLQARGGGAVQTG